MPSVDVLLLVLTATSAALVLRAPRTTEWAVWATAAATVVWALQLYSRGPLLIFAPVYGYLGISALVLRPLHRRRRKGRLLGAIGLVGVVLGGVAFALVWPPASPRPSGSYPVGVASLRLASDPPTTAPVYYPGDLPGAYRRPPRRAPAIQGAAAVPWLADQLGVPAVVLHHLRQVSGPGYLRIPLSRRKSSYPATVLVPPEGWGPDAVFAAAAETASHGTVVIVGCDEDLVDLVSRGVADAAMAGRIDTSTVSVAYAPSTPDFHRLFRWPTILGIPVPDREPEAAPGAFE